MGKTWRALPMLALLLVPMAAQAQKSNVWTRSADVYLDQGLKARNDQDKAKFLKDALEQAQLAVEKDPSNALGWQLLGKVYAATGDAARADSMLDKAETMYPEYAKADVPFREAAWIEAYNAGVRALQAQKIDEAIAHLQAANAVYQGRPSARMTLASIYTNRGDYDKAIDEYKGALEILQGPVSKTLKPEQQKEWQENIQRTMQRLAVLYGVTKKYDQAEQLYRQQVAANPNDLQLKLGLARALALGGKEAEAKTMFVEIANAPNLADDDYIEAGAALFRSRDFDDAAMAFRKGLAANPNSHAGLYNLAQTLIAQAAPLVAQLDSAKPAERGATAAKLAPIADEMGKISTKYLELEPANTYSYLMAAQQARIEANIASTPSAKGAASARALSFLQKRDSMAYEVGDTKLALSDDGGKLMGTVTNKRLTAGAPITFTVSFLGKDGAVLDTQTVTVQAPAKEQTVAFSATSKAKNIISWKYAMQ